MSKRATQKLSLSVTVNTAAQVFYQNQSSFICQLMRLLHWMSHHRGSSLNSPSKTQGSFIFLFQEMLSVRNIINGLMCNSTINVLFWFPLKIKLPHDCHIEPLKPRVSQSHCGIVMNQNLSDRMTTTVSNRFIGVSSSDFVSVTY